MKTKEKLLALICLLTCISGATAQTHYYNTTQTFNENGYVYKCDVPAWQRVTLYNINNQFVYANQTYKNGSSLEKAYYDRPSTDYIENDSWTKPLCHSIVNNAFSAAEKQRVQGIELGICMIINSDTGAVIEVNFSFMVAAGFATIPVSVYRQIELGLKQNIWFTPTVEGNKLNYLMHYWRHEVK